MACGDRARGIRPVADDRSRLRGGRIPAPAPHARAHARERDRGPPRRGRAYAEGYAPPRAVRCRACIGGAGRAQLADRRIPVPRGGAGVARPSRGRTPRARARARQSPRSRRGAGGLARPAARLRSTPRQPAGGPAARSGHGAAGAGVPAARIAQPLGPRRVRGGAAPAGGRPARGSVGLARLAVDPRERVREARGDLCALHLEGGREQAVVHGPRLRRGDHPTHPHVAGKGTEPGVGAAHQRALVGLPGHRDQADEGMPLADQHHLLERGVVEQRRLGLLGRELLPVGEHDDVLAAAADVQSTLLDLDQVAGAEPAVGREHLRGGLGIAPVALHHRGASHLQLALRGQAPLEPIQGGAYRRGIVVVLAVGGDDRRGLGHAVALDDRQAQPDEGARDPQFQLRAAGRRQPQPPAQALQDRARHPSTQRREQHSLGQARLAIEGLPAQAHGGREQPLPQSGGRQRLVDAGEEALVEPRYRQQQRRADRGEILAQLLDAPRVGHAGAGLQHQVVATGALEHVGQRQHGQRDVLAVDRDHPRTRAQVPQHVAVGELHALGSPGGAGGVDEGGERIVADRAHLERRCLRGQEGVQPGGFVVGDGFDADERGRIGHAFAQSREHPRRVEHQQPCPRVLQAGGDVVGVVDHVEGHHHERESQRSLVDGDPLGAVLQADRHPVAGLEAVVAEGLLPARGEGEHVRGRILAPARRAVAVLPLPVQDPGGVVRVAGEQVGKAVGHAVPLSEVGMGVSRVPRYFAPCPRGLEAALAQELTGIGAGDLLAVPGGVSFSGDLAVGYRANLESRLASRVLRALDRGVYRGEQDLYALVKAIDWPRWFTVDRTLRVDVTAIDSPLKSLEFATLRIKDAVCDRFRAEMGARPSVDTRTPDVRIQVFLAASEATVYLDLSGEPLFKRGWRTEVGEAPLRENLAAGLLALAGWQPGTVLLDPMCGSGTIPIEAAQRAIDRAPGLERAFGFERLRDHDAGLWASLVAQARSRVRRPARALRVFGSDREGAAIVGARANAARAGVAEEKCILSGMANSGR